jgi:tetratricopeptide (TPR) repeat protein
MALVAVVLAVVAAARSSSSSSSSSRSASRAWRALGVVCIAVPALWFVGALWLAGGAGVHARMISRGVLALWLGAQLLWMALTAEPRLARKSFDGFAHLGLAFVIGALLLVDLPWIASRALAIEINTALLAFQAALLIAHAVVDASAWRMSDPALCRALSDRALPRAPSGRAQVSNWRALAFAVPGMFLALGVAVDLVQTALTVPLVVDLRLAARRAPGGDAIRVGPVPSAPTTSGLELASLISRRDARIDSAIAEIAVERYIIDDAHTALGNSEVSHAFAPAVVREQVAACAESTHGWRARKCNDLVPPWLKDDATVLAWQVFIALRAGDGPAARAFADRVLVARDNNNNDDDASFVAAAVAAAAAHNGNSEAQQTLALAIDARSRELASSLGGNVRTDALIDDARFADAGLALASAYHASKRYDQALITLDRVLAGSDAQNRSALALSATSEKARVLDEKGDARSALSAYQHALQLAATVDDPGAASLLWLDYGGLLRRSAASEEAQIACILEANLAYAAVAADAPDKARLKVLTEAATGELDAFASDARAKTQGDLVNAATRALALAYPEQPSP